MPSKKTRHITPVKHARKTRRLARCEAPPARIRCASLFASVREMSAEIAGHRLTAKAINRLRGEIAKALAHEEQWRHEQERNALDQLADNLKAFDLAGGILNARDLKVPDSPDSPAQVLEFARGLVREGGGL